VSVAVTMVTAAKPVSQLVGLVYSETPKEQRTDPEAHRLPWYRSPTKLAGISLVMVIILNVIFR
jgi:solute:Na+ symporter, SSS family